MGGEGYSDRIEVVNGPEDGAAFPITRGPVSVGSEPGCGVFLRFDREVRGVHARITVVSEGYRVRRQSGGPLLVNGKRVGRIHSRILRSGGIMQVGDTELVLQCAPGGLAGRSHGVPSESDLGWAVRILWGKLRRGLHTPWCMTRDLFGRHFWLIVVIAVVAGALSFYRPGTISWAWYTLLYYVDWTVFNATRLYHWLFG